MTSTLLRSALPFILALLSSTEICSSEWDREYWQYFDLENWHSGPSTFYTTGALRVYDDVSEISYYRITGNFAYRCFSSRELKTVWGCRKVDLDLEAHYSYYASKPEGDSHFSHNQRLELEANPDFSFCNGTLLKTRNRLELEKKEHVKHIEFVLRHKFHFHIPVEGYKYLTAIGFSDELFYHFENNTFTQNRLIPLHLTFSLCQARSLGLFFMIRNHKSGSHWLRSFVFGTEIELGGSGRECRSRF